MRWNGQHGQHFQVGWPRTDAGEMQGALRTALGLPRLPTMAAGQQLDRPQLQNWAQQSSLAAWQGLWQAQRSQ